MVQLLEGFERRFPNLEGTRAAQTFKGDIKTACNDLMRCTRDELREYVIEYTPLRLDENSTLSLTREFLQTIQCVEFGLDTCPWICFYAGDDRRRVLEAVRAEFDEGVLFEVGENEIVLQIVGLNSCIKSVLPIMDKYRFQPGVRSEYEIWRKEVVKTYKDKANG